MFKKLLFSSLLLAGSITLLATTPDDSKLVKGKINTTSVDIPTDLDKNFDDLLTLWATNGGGTLECEYDKEAAVLFDDSTYMKRLYALPTQMELAYNDIVKRFIEMYADRRRGQVSYMLGQGRYYFPMFEEELDKEGLPLELKYLPVIESALNPIARSRVGATGLWQFMPATGKMYKLEINSLVDERRDPYRSTQAAVKYLKDMYAIYGDWNLVIAAYNCGPGNVNKAIRRSGGKRDYWDLYPFLPKETRGYVPAFIAATYIMSYHSEHKICPAETDLPVLIDTLSVNKVVHFGQIADIINVSVDDLRKLNPQFKEDIIPGEYKEYALKLPIHDLTAFIENQDTIYTHRADELLTHQKTRSIASVGNVGSGGGHATYRVKKGDTLGAIAMRNRVSIAQIRRWNGMKSDRLNIGQTLKVSDYIAPKKIEVLAKADNSKNLSSANVQKEKISELLAEDGVLKRNTTVTKTITSTYKVQKGDTWQGVAKKTGASISEIKKWNGVTGNGLIAGKVFKIHKTEVVEELAEVAKPEEITLALDSKDISSFLDTYIEELNIPEPTITMGLMNAPVVDADDGLDEANVIYHKVIYGETMSQIAERYNVTVADILSWNNITQKTSSQATRLLIILPEKKTENPQIAKNDQVSDDKTAQL